MEFQVACRHPRLAPADRPARALLDALLRCGAYPLPVDGELSLALVTDDEIGGLHGRFMDDPSPTDVITFPPDPDFGLAGEIVVSVDRAREVSAELSLPFSDELRLYIIHGWLHLAGFDDRSDETRAEMRAAEKRAVGLLAAAGTLPEFVLR